MTKKAVIAILATGVIALAGLSVSAQSTTSVADATALIRQLQEQIKTLQAQVEAMRKATATVRETQSSIRDTLSLLRELREGMTGDDVTALQAALAADPEIYPEGLITGFYGKLTSSAVKRFQKKHGFEQVGNVGPLTLKEVNKLLKEHPLKLEDDDDDDDEDNDHEDGDDDKRGLGIGRGKQPCAIVPPGHMIAPGWLKKHNGEKPVIPPCQTIPPGIFKKLPPGATTTPPTPPPPPPADTVAPVISVPTATSTTASTSRITWTTNEASDGKVWYGTTTPVSTASASSVTHTGLLTSHTLDLAGLNASTTYYYLIVSKDAASNTATSSEQNFLTLP